jgi:lipid-A-disaccharide synthase
MYAARLATALKQRLDVAIFGMGGPQMRAAGVEIITDYSEVSVVGITEVLKRLPSLFRAMRRLVHEAELRRPPLAILTDFPGFHLRLARKLRPQGIRNVYYICPQFWAWRPWRVNLVRRRFAQALCIFPFEETFYADAGVPAKFIGHPLVGNVKPTMTREFLCKKYGLEERSKILTMLPGSRRGEIAHHVPVLVEALAEIRQRLPDPPEIVVAVAPGLDVRRLEARFPSDWHVRFVEDDTYNALAAELIQNDFTPQRVAAEAVNLLSASEESKTRVEEMIRGLGEVRRLLGPPGAVERAADEIVKLLNAAKSNAK